MDLQDTFTSMRDLYYKNGDGFLLVYSITDSSSVEDVKERYQSLLTVRVSQRNNLLYIHAHGDCTVLDSRNKFHYRPIRND